jgi:rfaE bifunctional protein nucleotidyltransferase chain/domain
MKDGKRVVLVGGCFDILHFGHISFLKKAKSYGDYLLIALESDENVRRVKGNARPIHSQNQRKEMLEALSFVDEVMVLPPMRSDEEYFDMVKKVKPDIIALTEGDPILHKKMEQGKQTGAEVVIIEKITTPSTSQLAKLLGLE